MPFEIIIDDIYNLEISAFVRQYIPFRTNIAPSATLRRAEDYHKRMEQYKKRQHQTRSDNPEVLWWLRHKADSIINVTMFRWDDDTARNRRKLGECYDLVLACAQTHHVKSLAIPLLGTDSLGCPLHIAGKIAICAINDWLSKHPSSMQVYLVISLREKDRFYDLADQSQNILLPDNNNVSDSEKASPAKNRYAEWDEKRKEALRNSGLSKDVFFRKQIRYYFDNYLTTSKAEFARAIFYNKSNVGRFIKGEIYTPAKQVVIAMAIQLGLSDEERYDFIRCAGYDYPVSLMDRQVEMLLRSGCAKLLDINEKLCEINPDFALIKDIEKKSSKKSTIAER